MPDKRDNLYKEIDSTPGSFAFDSRVAEVFNDMIARSVPGYRQIIGLLPTLVRQFNFAHRNYYDLGCSTGAGLLAMASGLEGSPARLIGIDNSAAMLAQAETLTDPLKTQANLSLQLLCDDICEAPLHNAAMVLMNFTLQFIPLEQRDELLRKVHQALVSGGILVLSEKLQSSNDETQRLLTRIHHQFKADQGYSALEISKKRDAIENVLLPETLETHLDRLRSAGFATTTPWIRNLQFVSILAVKN